MVLISTNEATSTGLTTMKEKYDTISPEATMNSDRKCIKSNNNKSQVWREDTRGLPLLPSPSNTDSFYFKTAKTIPTKNTAIRKEMLCIPSSSSSRANDTSLEIETTKSTKLYESSDSNFDETILLAATAGSISNNDTGWREILCPLHNTKCLNSRELVESQSSMSQASVIRKWSSKYDTEDKDNYDSDDGEYDEDLDQDEAFAETREDAEVSDREAKEVRDTDQATQAHVVGEADDEERLLLNSHASDLLSDAQCIVSDNDPLSDGLLPLAFELDCLSSQEVEEEVIFDEDDNDNGHCHKEIDLKTEKVNEESKGDELLEKLTETITNMCLTSQAQQLLLAQDSSHEGIDSVESDHRTETSVTKSSSSAEYPNIELELCHGDEGGDVDEIVIVDAVARALRESKRQSKRNKKLRKNDLFDCLATSNSPTEVFSDAMDVLMSLTVMECCRSPINTRPDELSTTQSIPPVITSSNSGTKDVFKPKHTGDDSNFKNGNFRNIDDDDESFHGCRDAITVSNSRNSENKKNKKLVKGSGDTNTGKQCQAASKSQSCETKVKVALDLGNLEKNNFVADTTGLELDDMAFENLDLMVESDTLAVDDFPKSRLWDNDRFRNYPNGLIESRKLKSPKDKLMMVPLKRDKTHNTTINMLSSAMTSSFELLSPLSSCEDCRIPSPPQNRKNVVASNEQRNKLDSYSLENPILSPIHNSLPKTPSKGSITASQSRAAITNKKKKSFSNFNTPESTSVCKGYPISSSSKIEDESKHCLNLESAKQGKKMPHLAINKMIRNIKKKSITGKAMERKSNKITSLHLDTKDLANNDCFHIEKQSVSPHSPPSPSMVLQTPENKKFFNDKEKDQENLSPNPCQQPRDKNIGRSSPKSILRVKYKGALGTPSNCNRSVHWDEEQLANKVEKGIMRVSNRKNIRAMRKLNELMQQITLVQDDHGNELEQLLGLKSITQGYIC